MKYRRLELLILEAAKEIKDHEICVVGQGIAIVAGAIAKKRQAPNAIILTEAGMVDIDPFQNLEDIADPGSFIGYSYSIDLFDVFTTIVNRGYCDICILGAAQVDKFGNINSTVIGNYLNYGRKDIRLSGSGGANEFLGHSKRTIITCVGGDFVEKLDYFTSPGWLSGGEARKKAGLPGGPSAVFSTYGVFRFHETTKEMYLAALLPKTTVEDAQKDIPWKLKTAEDFGGSIVKIKPPTLEDLKFMREVEPFLGIGGNDGRRLQAQTLPVYFEGKRPNE